jgi:hypothetical protein
MPLKFPDAARSRAYMRKHKYGITQAEWDALFTSQGNRCAICKTDHPGSVYDWHTDHCHNVNKVRGILCHQCNNGLRLFKDSSTLLKAAAKYVELFEEASE